MVSAPVAIVDDDPHTLAMLTEVFTGAGISVLTYPDGASAYEMLCWQPPRLIILELCLRNGSGWQLFSQLRANPTTAFIPVIVCATDVHLLHPKGMDFAALHCRAVQKPCEMGALLRDATEMMAERNGKGGLLPVSHPVCARVMRTDRAKRHEDE